MRKYQREWMRSRRNAWIDKNGPCKHCGSKDNLEIDHIDPKQKELSVNNIWSRKKEVQDAELSKCQVLCHECHIKKTAKDFGFNKSHGVRGYSRGCRCEICTTEKTKSVNEWRWRTGRRKKRV